MSRRNTKKHSYVLSLAVSLVIVGCVWKLGILKEEDQGIALYFPPSVDEVQAVSDHTETEELPDEAVAEAGEPEALTDGGTQETEVLPDTSEEAPEPETESAAPAEYEAELSYFDDALFIGDSRTVGLREYGNLGNAEVVADAGMNVYKIFDKEFETATGEKKTLEEVLSERQFGKIYVMLGINELGYEYERTVSRYEELLGRIRQWQPEAKLFLEANLHITGKKSEASPIYTNENINRFNQAVEQMADGQTSFYLDVNVLFDDEEGNLSEEYTMDNAHVLGKYYADWVDWILKHAR